MVTSASAIGNTGIKPDGAYLKNLETNEMIVLQFNPTEYSFSKSNGWSQDPIVGFDVAPTEFTGGQPTQLKLDLFFDTYGSQEAEKEDVRDYTKRVIKLAQIEENTISKGRGRPPRVLFGWGTVYSFQAVVTSVSVRYSLFDSNGRPVRATLSLALQESKSAKVQEPQNPTTQGTWGYKYYLVKPQDRIDRIAYEVYGDPSLWREIATENDLDNPTDLEPGTQIVIKPWTGENGRS